MIFLRRVLQQGNIEQHLGSAILTTNLDKSVKSNNVHIHNTTSSY